MHYYEVAPTKIIRANNDTLTYGSKEPLALGTIVHIPVGTRIQIGVVTTKTQKPKYEIKMIAGTIEKTPLPLALIALADWMHTYYATPLATVWQTLLPAGLTTKRKHRVASRLSPVRERTNFLLNKDQLLAVKKIDNTPGTHLLHGVTGSGKTAVYVELAQKALARNKSTIILVPEIALTSQLVDVFTQHFGKDVILTHSQQSPAQRHITWNECLTSDTPKVVLGPRSALFMPLATIGLIVIDEAHEPSYKQDKSPRYNALRAASTLAEQHSAALVLGSATPSITDFFLAEKKHKIISLPLPAKKPTTPSLTIVDATKRADFKRHRFLSDPLLRSIEQTLATNHQVLIFHNRRGSATVSFCDSCGWQAGCINCFLPLTLHADTHSLRCHACGYSAKVPTHCPQCSSTGVLHRGIGTKLIEEELRKIFTHATIARFDADTEKSATLDKRYAEIYNGDIDILIGTQILAKGLDLPKLRLVGIPQADAGLHLPDYTSAERTFQLISQVVGRVGRYDHPAQVVMQTYHPTHPAIQSGLTQNYSAFYEYALPLRKHGGFPPYNFLLKITAIYKTESAAIANIKKLADILGQKIPHATIGRPTPSFYERSPQGYRWQLVVKSTQRAELLEAIKHIPPGLHWQYDIDPASLL